jgi:hypothetical protein
MESKENKDLDGFVKRKLDEIPVEYQEAHWDKAFLVLEAAVPLLPKTNWFWWMGGVDLFLLAGSATWFASTGNDGALMAQKQQSKNNPLKAKQEQVVNLPSAEAVIAANNNQTQAQTPEKTGKEKANYYAFRQAPPISTSASSMGSSLVKNTIAAKEMEEAVHQTSSESLNNIVSTENQIAQNHDESANTTPPGFVIPASNQESPSKTESEQLASENPPSSVQENNSLDLPSSVTENNADKKASESNDQQASALMEESSPPPDLAHADFDANSYFSLLGAAGFSPSLTQGYASLAPSYSLNVQFNRDFRENLTWSGSAGLSYRKGIDESTVIDQYYYGFGSSLVQNQVSWNEMLSTEIRGGLDYKFCKKQHLSLQAGAQFLLNTSATITSAEESGKQGWGYRQGFRKGDLILTSRYEYEVCKNWRTFIQYTQGFGDQMDDAFFNRNGKQRNASLLLGFHYLLRPGKSSSESNYVKP